MPVKGHKRIEYNQTLPSATTRGNRKSCVHTLPEDGETHVPRPPARGRPNKDSTCKIANRNHVSSRPSVEVKDKGHLDPSTSPIDRTPSTGNIEALFGRLSEIEQMVINVALHEIYSKCLFNKRSAEILRNRYSMYAVPLMAPLQSRSLTSMKEYVQKTRQYCKPDPKDIHSKCQSKIKIRHTKKSAHAKEEMLNKRRDNAKNPKPTKKNMSVTCSKDLRNNSVRQQSGQKQGIQNAEAEVFSREAPSEQQNPMKNRQRQKSARVKRMLSEDDSSSCIFAMLPKDSIEYVRHESACAKCSPYAKNGKLPAGERTKRSESTSTRVAKPKTSVEESLKCTPTPPKQRNPQQTITRTNRARRIVKKPDNSEEKSFKGYCSPQDGDALSPVDSNSTILTIKNICTEGSSVSAGSSTASATLLAASSSFINATPLSERYEEDLLSKEQLNTPSPLYSVVPGEQDEHCTCCKCKSSIERRSYGVQTELEVDDCATQCDDVEIEPKPLEMKSVCGASATESQGNAGVTVDGIANTTSSSKLVQTELEVDDCATQCDDVDIDPKPFEMKSGNGASTTESQGKAGVTVDGTANTTSSTKDVEEQFEEKHSEKYIGQGEEKREEKCNEKSDEALECVHIVDINSSKITVPTDTVDFYATEVTTTIFHHVKFVVTPSSWSHTSLHDDDDDIIFGNNNLLELCSPTVDEAIAKGRPFEIIDSTPDPPDNSERIKIWTEPPVPDMTEECSYDGDLQFLDMHQNLQRIATAVLQYTENMDAGKKDEISHQTMHNGTDEACVSKSTFGAMKDLDPYTVTRQDNFDYDDDDDIMIGETRDKNETAEPLPLAIPEKVCQYKEQVERDSVVHDSAKYECSAPEITESVAPKLETVAPQIAGMSIPTKKYLLADTSEKACMDPANSTPDIVETASRNSWSTGPDVLNTRVAPHTVKTDGCSYGGYLRFINLHHNLQRIATAVLQYAENMDAGIKGEFSHQTRHNGTDEACVSKSTFGAMKDLHPYTVTRRDSIDPDDEDDIMIGETRDKNETAETNPPDIPEEACQSKEQVEPDAGEKDSAKCECRAPENTESVAPKLETVAPQIAGMSTPTHEFLLADTSEKACIDPASGTPDIFETASRNSWNAGPDVFNTRVAPHPLTDECSYDGDLWFINMHQNLQRIATAVRQYTENMDAGIKDEFSHQTMYNGPDEACVSKSTFDAIKDRNPNTVEMKDRIDHDDDYDITLGISSEKAVLNVGRILNPACEEDPCSSVSRSSLNTVSSVGVKLSSVVVGMSSADAKISNVSGFGSHTVPSFISTYLSSGKSAEMSGQLSKRSSNSNRDDNDDIVFGETGAHTFNKPGYIESARVPIITTARADDPCVRTTKHDYDEDIVFKVTEETDARAPGSENIVCVPDITQAVTTISPPSFDTVSYTYDMESPYGGREVPPSSDSTLTHVVLQGSIANTSRSVSSFDDRELCESRSASPVSIYSSLSIENISGSPGNNGSQTSVCVCDCQDDGDNANNSSSAREMRSLKDALSSRRSRPRWYQGLASMGFLPSIVVRSKYTKITNFPEFNSEDERRRE
ncbi:uncharacterized protein LOC127875236 isoform X6 [Dreissena polymorpha]|uniref:uncharacterized protein LOC127875236 isoform X6 n=1 Tax=Dreissena polymorpha TaxID=45954 RepID=UPI00226510BF|nr:uncharacterized protein LOC127875236 isoform X6 [Dreissena polymorpha]